MSALATIIVALGLASPPEVDPKLCPVQAVVPPAPDVGHPSWRLEAGLAFQPEQPRDYSCHPGVDCRSPSLYYVAGIISAQYRRLDQWSLGLTLALGRHEDLEVIPVDGFGIMTLRADFQLELGRGPGRFGAALRVSPVLVVGWSGTGSTVLTDLPGFALLIGERDLWGEVIVPAFPTDADPRLFYAGAGWHHGPYLLEGGVATFGSIGYAREEVSRAGTNFGLWLAATWTVPDGGGAPTPWELGAKTAIAYPFIAIATVAYRFDAP